MSAKGVEGLAGVQKAHFTAAVKSLLPQSRGERLAFGMLLLVAVVGQLIVTHATVTADIRAGLRGADVGNHVDFLPLWRASHAFAHGLGARPWYGTQYLIGYAPPYAVLFSPLGLLSASAAVGAAGIIAGACEVAALFLWARTIRGPRSILVPVLLSVPVVQVVVIDQLQAAFGLLSLSVALIAHSRARWFLVGVGLALGSLRISNALPVWSMVAVGLWGQPRAASRVALGVMAVFLPLLGVTFAWDPAWPRDYLVSISGQRLFGLIGIVQIYAGNAAAALVTAASCAFCAFLVRKSKGQPLDLDRAALGLASTVPVATLAGWYCAIFALPAVLRLASRNGMHGLAWGLGLSSWGVILALAPLLLGSDTKLTLDLMSTVAPIVIAVAIYPLARRLPSSAE